MLALSRALFCATTASRASATAPTPVRRVVKMHGLPRGWMHDEVVKFVDSVASRVGAAASVESSGKDSHHGDADDDEPSALPNSSTHVHRVRIPFGRKTGVIYGEPVIELNSSAVADALLTLTFDEYSDSRRRLHFSEVDADDYASKQTSAASRQQKEDEEDALALSTLDLDRFLLDPDLLYDMKKRRQRRRLTLRESIDIPSFRDNVDQPTVMDQGDTNLIGRGSPQNLDIPVPYVRGRRGF
jgi:hypothetical protein